ncbi:hypothetical protein AYI70_g5557 [Smittium culicis]|uniref:Ubinuclein middle domain-containing protein n=1 Tax=Smittium culicis TaxID=133412 RepID=A0A1R1XTY3_9FUNG|nr:hypothetical protein AYI70_g5557 [Smittium culicis]
MDLPGSDFSTQKFFPLKPGGDCVVIYWQDHATSPTASPTKPSFLPNHKIVDSTQNTAQPNSNQNNSDAELINSESEPEPDQAKLSNEQLPDAITKDPFFANLLKNAETYSKNDKNKKSIKRKAKDVEDDYDINDPFIDDSELLFMDGHAHSRVQNQRKNKLLLGPAPATTSDNPPDVSLLNEHGNILLDLELLDRPHPSDFFVYYGILEDSEQSSDDQTPLQNSIQSNSNTPAQTNPSNSPQNRFSSNKKSLPKPIASKNSSDFIPLSSVFPKNAIKSPQKISKKQNIPPRDKPTRNSLNAKLSPNQLKSITSAHTKLLQSIPPSPELTSSLEYIKSKVQPGIITNKNHFPYVLKSPLRKVCTAAINLTLEYESCILSELPLPPNLTPSESPFPTDSFSNQQNSNPASITPLNLVSSSNHTEANFGNAPTLSKTQIAQSNDNRIVSWEAATDLLDISIVYKSLTSFLPWSKATLRRIIIKLIGKNYQDFKELQLKNIEKCLAKKISESILNSSALSNTSNNPNNQQNSNNSSNHQNNITTSNNKSTPNSTAENYQKFVWNTVIRQLLFQYIKVYMEINGVNLSPIESENSTQERVKNQKLRRDAYAKLLHLWPNNTMNTSLIGKEYSYKKSAVANRIRKSLGSMAPNNKMTSNSSSAYTPPVVSKNLLFPSKSASATNKSTVNQSKTPTNSSVEHKNDRHSIGLIPTAGIKKIASSIEQKIIDLESKFPDATSKSNFDNLPASDSSKGKMKISQVLNNQNLSDPIKIYDVDKQKNSSTYKSDVNLLPTANKSPINSKAGKSSNQKLASSMDKSNSQLNNHAEFNQSYLNTDANKNSNNLLHPSHNPIKSSMQSGHDESLHSALANKKKQPNLTQFLKKQEVIRSQHISKNNDVQIPTQNKTIPQNDSYIPSPPYHESNGYHDQLHYNMLPSKKNMNSNKYQQQSSQFNNARNNILSVSPTHICLNPGFESTDNNNNSSKEYNRSDSSNIEKSITADPKPIPISKLHTILGISENKKRPSSNISKHDLTNNNKSIHRSSNVANLPTFRDNNITRGITIKNCSKADKASSSKKAQPYYKK